MINTIKQVANFVYNQLGSGHEEAVYRDAMSIELQDRGYNVKTEAPISIRYTTKKGNNMIVGGSRIDLLISKNNKFFIVELKTVSKMIKDNSKKTKNDFKEFQQLKKYLVALDVDNGALINFPFPPEPKIEIIT